MTESIVFMVLILVLIGTAVGALVLWGLARGLARISTAKFGNSLLVCIIATLIIFTFWTTWHLAGMDILTHFNFGSLVALNLILHAAAYIVVGKLIWKARWSKSALANLPWLLPYSISTGYMLSQISV
jgi:prepilin signal peptidase PulO-like enzyme (type II secretory pathway)